MVIEESIYIKASVEKVWKTFIDIACWQDWNSVMKNITTDIKKIEKGKTFRCTLRPYIFSLNIEPFIVDVVPEKLVVWIGSKFGIFARHEFLFESYGNGTKVTSKEFFKGIPVTKIPLLFPDKIIRGMTRRLLKDLKKTVEESPNGQN